jgi:hypothetical protein
MNLEEALLGGGTPEEHARLHELRTQESVPTPWKTVEVPDATDQEQEVDETGWPTDEEILSLWKTFHDAAYYVGYTPTIRDFGIWLAGSAKVLEVYAPWKDTDFEVGPAEVTW